MERTLKQCRYSCRGHRILLRFIRLPENRMERYSSDSVRQTKYFKVVCICPFMISVTSAPWTYETTTHSARQRQSEKKGKYNVPMSLLRKSNQRSLPFSAAVAFAILRISRESRCQHPRAYPRTSRISPFNTGVRTAGWLSRMERSQCFASTVLSTPNAAAREIGPALTKEHCSRGNRIKYSVTWRE